MKPCHSESVVRVSVLIHKLAIVTYFQWVMESHLLICYLTHPSYDQELTFSWQFLKDQSIEKSLFAIQGNTSESG